MRHRSPWVLALLIVVTPTLARGQGAEDGLSRLLFAPTGRPLPKGQGYFSDYELLFPACTYGLTDHLSVSGGVSVVPGLGLDEQLYYVFPRVAWSLSDKAAASVGVLYARAGVFGAIGAAAYGVGTFGGAEASLSIGITFGAVDEGRWRVHRAPALMVGGSKRLSPRLSFLAETWFYPRRDFLSQQPFGLGLRLLGDRLSADLGFVVTRESLDEGLPLPWLSVTYRFPAPRHARQP